MENPGRILFAGPGYYHWVTSDFGRTFSKVQALMHVPGPRGCHVTHALNHCDKFRVASPSPM